MEQNRQAFDVFVSYHDGDKPFVIELASRLRDRSLRVWVDVWELRPGLSWQDGLAQGLNASKSCAVMIGETGFGAWHRKEVEAALARQGPDYPVVPVLLPRSPDRILGVPPTLIKNGPDQQNIATFLGLMTWVDLRRGLDDTVALDRLVWGITGLRPDQKSTLVRQEHPCDQQFAHTINYSITNPKDGDLLIGPSKVAGGGPANEWVFLHFRLRGQLEFQLAAQTKTTDAGTWEALFQPGSSFPEQLPQGPMELRAAGPLGRFPSQSTTVYYRDDEAVKRPCLALAPVADRVEIKYELYTAFIQATQLQKQRLIYCGSQVGETKDIEKIAEDVAGVIVARFVEMVPKQELPVTGSVDADGRLSLEPRGMWASYYAFPVPREMTLKDYGFSPKATPNPFIGRSTGQVAWKLQPHVDRIPANPFGDAYRGASEYLEIRCDGYRPEFVALDSTRPFHFSTRLAPVLHKRIAVLDFPSIDSTIAVGTFSQVIAWKIVDAIRHRVELEPLDSLSDTETISDVLTPLDVRAVEQELKAVDTELFSGEGRHLKRKSLDIHYIVRGSYRVYPSSFGTT
jgi:hypothetical protein